MMGDYGLLMRFNDQSPSFVNGFECGILWNQMEARQAIEATVHTENAMQIKRMAQVKNYDADLVQTETEGWLFLKAIPQQPEMIPSDSPLRRLNESTVYPGTQGFIVDEIAEMVPRPPRAASEPMARITTNGDIVPMGGE